MNIDYYFRFCKKTVHGCIENKTGPGCSGYTKQQQQPPLPKKTTQYRTKVPGIDCWTVSWFSFVVYTCTYTFPCRGCVPLSRWFRTRSFRPQDERTTRLDSNSVSMTELATRYRDEPHPTDSSPVHTGRAIPAKRNAAHKYLEFSRAAAAAAVVLAFVSFLPSFLRFDGCNP